MFDQNGLSLDQAPPISVVLRFFLSGALFGIVAGLLILVFNTAIFDPAAIEAVILTHTLTLGVMLSFMFAALFQMLPVIAGVKLTAPVRKANMLQYPFILGVIVLLFAFYSGKVLLFTIASFLLGGAILSITVTMLRELLKLPNHSSSSKGMSIALIALGILTILALYMTGTLGGIFEGMHYLQVKQAHFTFGLFGWIALLIISISFQVIEMFYVTPSYPTLMHKHLPLSLLILIGTGTLLSPIIADVWSFVTPLLALLMVLYALITLKRLTQRKRPITDATVLLWRIGTGLLIASMLLMLSADYSGYTILAKLSYLSFAGFAISIVFAMFYKIVPFLTWFHLSSQGYFTAPMMHEVIHPKTAMRHFYIHSATLLVLALSLFFSPLIYLGGFLTLLSFGWILWQIIHAWRLYLHTQRTGEKFEMNIPTT